MTINSSNNMFSALQMSRDYEMQTIMEIINARSAASSTSNRGGLNPADSAGSVNGPKSVGDSSGNSETDNTIQAYGLMAQISMLSEEYQKNPSTALGQQIMNDVTQLQSLVGPGMNPNIDPTCLQNALMALGCFTNGDPVNNPSGFTTDVSNFMTFWNNPSVPGSGTAPFNPMSDAFAWLVSANPSLNNLSAADGFGLMMLFLSIDGNKTEGTGLEGNLNNYLTNQKGGLQDMLSTVQNFVYTYAASIGISPEDLFNMLPAPLDATDGYGQLYALMKSDNATFAENMFPSPTDPNYQEEMEALAASAWVNLKGCPLNPSPQ